MKVKDQYDTRHTVFRPALMSAGDLERGYWRAYRDFYRWGSIARGASAHANVVAGLRHLAYAAGWKKFEPLWDLVIRAKRAGMMLPVLETILSEFGRRSPESSRRSPESIRPERPDPATPPIPIIEIQRSAGIISRRIGREATQESSKAWPDDYLVELEEAGSRHRGSDCPDGQDWR
jgi:hypothetical protein